jgi:hypothetical protein
MSKAHLDLLKLLWVGFRLTADSRSVLTRNGNVVARVLARTITECAHLGWIALDPSTARYRLTDAGRKRVLVKERVRSVFEHLADQSA